MVHSSELWTEEPIRLPVCPHELHKSWSSELVCCLTYLMSLNIHGNSSVSMYHRVGISRAIVALIDKG